MTKPRNYEARWETFWDQDNKKLETLFTEFKFGMVKPGMVIVSYVYRRKYSKVLLLSLWMRDWDAAVNAETWETLSYNEDLDKWEKKYLVLRGHGDSSTNGGCDHIRILGDVGE